MPKATNLGTFQKYDTGKPMVSLVESKFIFGVAEVLTFGAVKYGPNNWKLGTSEDDIRRYKDALLRHVLAYTSGEINDPESGLSHLHHASANLMFLDYLQKP